ncbi:MAG: nickel-dependent hydrogenase large subunit, partial [Chloroflexi bacterium]|nr:nickel-dependent hydrogenase large subunit [Chloroflexota bacterium]
ILRTIHSFDPCMACAIHIDMRLGLQCDNRVVVYRFIVYQLLIQAVIGLLVVISDHLLQG